MKKERSEAKRIMHLCLSAVVLALAFTLFSCFDNNEQPLTNDVSGSIEPMDIMKIDTTANLILFYPQFSKIDLVCGEMPSETDERIILVCGAAFTGEKMKHFSHSNIAGNHVSNGRFYQGYEAETNTGVFAFYKGKWRFAPQEEAVKAVSVAADNQGMAFGQKLIIYNKETLPAHIKGRRRFRALCERKGKLCFVEGRRLQDFHFFVNELQHKGITNAIYLNTGKEWNYSWYRDNNGMVHRLHPKQDPYATNWIVFYK